jgi:integrin beta 3
MPAVKIATIEDELGTAVGRARGLHDPRARYLAMDVVAFNRSEWRAKYDDPGPLPGDGWMLGAKGSRGKPGERGRDGVHVTAIETAGYCLVLSLSSGQTLRVDLQPMLKRFAREHDR